MRSVELVSSAKMHGDARTTGDEPRITRMARMARMARDGEGGKRWIGRSVARLEWTVAQPQERDRAAERPIYQVWIRMKIASALALGIAHATRSKSRQGRQKVPANHANGRKWESDFAIFAGQALPGTP